MTSPKGISAVVLAKHAVIRRSADPISVQELRNWLLSAGLARLDERGLLTPTALAVELAGALRALEGA